MKNIGTSLLISLFLILTLQSCSSEFSKYEKNGKNDVEKAGYKGNVKQVDTYSNKVLTKTVKYNKYGFTIEDVDFDENGKSIKSVIYTYNEWGKVQSKECTDLEVHYLCTYNYDEYGNEISCFKEIIEVFNSNLNVKPGKSEVYHYELEYDQAGALVSAGKYTRDGKLLTNTKYDSNGSLVQVDSIEDSERVGSTKYEYHPNGAPKTIGYFNGCCGQLARYDTLGRECVRFDYLINYKGDKVVDLLYEFEYDNEGNCIRSKTLMANLFQNIIEGYVTEKQYNSHGQVISSVDYKVYPNGEVNYNEKYNERTDYKYEYDDKGNIIKENPYGVEMTYKFTYYN